MNRKIFLGGVHRKEKVEKISGGAEKFALGIHRILPHFWGRRRNI
jgi:hypothetical protein